MSTNRTQAADRQAAEWLAKRDGGNWTQHDEAQLDAWLADTGNRISYLRLEASWNSMNRLRALGAGYPRGQVPTPEELDKTSWHARIEPAADGTSTPRRARWYAVAASLLLAVAAATYFGADHFRGTRYSTTTGAVTTVPLKDGTNITLSTASTVRVELGDRERHIDLAAGEAYFDVAHDPNRPFVVQVGAKRIVAVGTKFAVRRDNNDVRVIVTEGKVRLEQGEGSAAPELLVAGSVAKTKASTVHVQTLALPEAEEQLSWRTGYVVFHETPLADAVAEFNRYNERKLVIDDPVIAAMPLSGKFRATNIDSFTSLLEQSFQIRVTADRDRIVLTERPSRAP